MSDTPRTDTDRDAEYDPTMQVEYLTRLHEAEGWEAVARYVHRLVQANRAEVRRQARAEVAASALAVAEAHDQKARDEGLLEDDKESLLTFELRADTIEADQ